MIRNKNLALLRLVVLALLLVLNLQPALAADLDDAEDDDAGDVDTANYQQLAEESSVDDPEAIQQLKMLANQILDKRKRKKGGLFKKPKEVSLSSILFPGMTPKEYSENQKLHIWVDEVTSPKSPVPFRLIDLPGTCQSFVDNYVGKTMNGKRRRGKPERSHIKNLGERLSSRNVQRPAPYDVAILQDRSCTQLCSMDLEQDDLDRLVTLIKRQYAVNLFLDGLPLYVKNKAFGVAMRGYPVGAQLQISPKSSPRLKTDSGTTETQRSLDEDDGEDQSTIKYLLYNHVKFTIEVHSPSSGSFHIVGFSVRPISFDHQKPLDRKDTSIQEGESLPTCRPKFNKLVNAPNTVLELKIPQGKKYLRVHYTYEIEWKQVNTPWADRWDVYLLGIPDDSTAHHMSILNSFMITIFLSAIVSIILIKNLRRDIAAYNGISVSLEDARLDEDESGWKLLHGDVFRPPSAEGTLFFGPMGLSVLVGSGCQIGVAVLCTLALGMARILNPMKKGQALSTIVILYAISGIIAGYVSSRLYKFCGGKDWKRNTVLTATVIPGMILFLFVILNICLSFARASSAVSFGMIVAVFLIWTCISTPLVLIGAFVGYKRDVIKVPMKTNQIARVVPTAHWCFSTNSISLFIGALPLSTVCIEIYYILGAIWLHQFYYLLGYLLASVVMLAVVSALMSTLLCYVRLCAEDHRWWWKSYADTFSSSIWLMIYSLWYLSARLQLMGFLPIVVYVMYMTVASVALGMFCGSVGFLSSLWFVKTIYGALKID
jgi:transmembrane 9 superfamily protein 2/4